ncbi:GbsR/MarR family transcriptional regulator [Niallia sp. FSL M8-0099]|uniref:GbsR/MarR family transcriptional regulator n=1 Tax=Niallia sp. FSL M8-0099 TaxID=2954519 RepID=UPI0030F9040C
MDINELEYDEEKQVFVEKLGIYYEDYGIPRIGGRILGLLLVSNQPISAEQMSNLLKVSRGSVSTNVRLLVSMGLLEKVSAVGDRTDYYSVSESIWDNAIKTRIDGFKNLKNIVELGLKALEEHSDANKKFSEMLLWVDSMISSHEKVLLEWRKEIKDRN